MKKTRIIVVLIMILALTGCSRETANDIQYNSSNTANGAMIDTDGQNLYIALNGIYRFDKNLQSQDTVTAEGFVTLVLDGDWIISKINSGHNRGIYRLKKDGTNLEQLTDIPGVYLSKTGENLYFVHDGIYQLNVETRDIEKLSEDDAQFLSFYQNQLFYSNAADEGRIYRFPLDTLKPHQLTQEAATFMVMEGEWIYYSTDGALYRIKDDGSGKEVVQDNFEAIVTSMAVKDEIVYFSVRDVAAGGWRLYRAAPQEDLELLHETRNQISNLHLINDYLLYRESTNLHWINLANGEKGILEGIN
jgi:hypothetical protein